MEERQIGEIKTEEVSIEKITVSNRNKKYLKLITVVYYVLGVLEVLLAFRFVLKLLGANTKSAFVSFIYKLSGILLAPFNGIFRSAVNQGLETKSVLEPANLIAMVVYALIAYGIVRIIQIYAIPKEK